MVTTITDRLIDNRLAQGILVPVRQVWMAGWGACSLMERKGGELFRALCQHGEETETQALKQAKQVTEGLEKRFEKVQRGLVSKQVNQLESTIQKRVIGQLSRLGIPSLTAVQHLTRTVEALQQQVDELITLDQAKRTAVVKKNQGSKVPPSATKLHESA